MWECFGRSLFILLWQNFVVASEVIEASVQFSEINGFGNFCLCDKNLSLIGMPGECDLFIYLFCLLIFFW